MAQISQWEHNTTKQKEKNQDGCRKEGSREGNFRTEATNHGED